MLEFEQRCLFASNRDVRRDAGGAAVGMHQFQFLELIGIDWNWSELELVRIGLELVGIGLKLASNWL